MQDIIRLLPDAIANQIAAGEVVQRPASVIKELLENAIDAQATHIQVLVKEAGKQSMQIIDNGIGMSETDARMCFERHATSKIRKADDLFKLRTMGFRGEALASIAAIAQVELKTCRAIDDLGTMIRIEAAEIKAQEAIQHPVGTSIMVKNLFYNIPARRNFLKSDNVEKHHILDEFIHIALSQPKISFVFTHNDHEIYRLPASKLSQRIIHLFGKNYKEQLAFCDETTSLVSVKGYVGKPSTSKKSKGEQYFFVNERYIKSSYLHHAVLKAYDRLISADTHPFYVLFLEIDPSRIDVNVHPKKTEIKFEDEQSVYTILLSAVRKALSMHQFVPAIDFGQDAKLDSFLNIDTKPDNRANLVSGFENERSRPKSQQIESWRRLYEDLGQQAVHQELLQSDIITQSEELQTIDSQANFINPQKEGVDDAPRRSFQILQKYLIAPIKTGLLIVDQLAARQRIHYDLLMNQQNKQVSASQQLLFPIEVELSPTEIPLFERFESLLTESGFIFTKQNHIVVFEAMPYHLGEQYPLKNFFQKLMEEFSHENPSEILSREKFVFSLVKHSLSRLPLLTEQEVGTLINQLFATQNPNYTPDGKKIWIQLDGEHLDHFFS